MKPGNYMLFGGSIGLSFVVAAAIMPQTIAGSAMCIFAAGALFGKGYGVWEESSRRFPTPSQGREKP